MEDIEKVEAFMSRMKPLEGGEIPEELNRAVIEFRVSRILGIASRVEETQSMDAYPPTEEFFARGEERRAIHTAYKQYSDQVAKDEQDFLRDLRGGQNG